MDDTDLVLWMAMHRRGVLATVAFGPYGRRTLFATTEDLSS